MVYGAYFSHHILWCFGKWVLGVRINEFKTNTSWKSYINTLNIFIKSLFLLCTYKTPWNTRFSSLSLHQWGHLIMIGLLWGYNNVLESLRTHNFFVINKFERGEIQMYSKTCSWPSGSFTNSKAYHWQAKMSNDHLSHSHTQLWAYDIFRHDQTIFCSGEEI